MRRRALPLAVALGVALALAGAAVAGNGGLLPPPAHSPNAHRITTAYIFILGFAAAVFLLVEGALVLFIVKYRRGKRPRDLEGPQIHGATRLEVIWTVIPVLILAAIATFVFYELPGIANAPTASAADETTITVEGHQFYWLFRYPGGGVSINTMIAPAGEVVHENITSPDTDVIHGWWVPELGGKTDAIPGRVNHSWFEAPLGAYVARCTQLCGIQHAHMVGHVQVVPAADYDQFVRDHAVTGRELGEQEFTGVCMSCHRLNERYVGPALGGNPLLTDRRGIETILRQGVGNMPAVGSDWSDAQIDALVEYAKTLKGASGNNG